MKNVTPNKGKLGDRSQINISSRMIASDPSSAKLGTLWRCYREAVSQQQSYILKVRGS